MNITLAIAGTVWVRSITNAADGASTFRKPVDNIGSESIPNDASHANNHTYDIVTPGATYC